MPPAPLRLGNVAHRRNINVEAAEATTFKMPSIRVHPWLIPSGLHGFLNRGFDVLVQAEEVLGVDFFLTAMSRS